MKKMKKIMALVIAVVMCLAMAVPVMAADHTITITRDTTYDTETTESTGVGFGAETYTWYKILSADIGELGTTNPNTGVTDPLGTVAYYIDATTANTNAANQKAALEGLTVTINGESKTLFTITTSADGTRYNVRLSDDAASVSGSQIADALNGMSDTQKNYFTHNTVTRSGNSDVVITAPDGYYFITSSLGSALVVETIGNVTIKEKNQYPSVDKTQNDTATNGTYVNTAVNVGIGDTIYYQTLVYVPSTVNNNITLTDVMSNGLTPASAETITAQVSDTKDGTYTTLEKGDSEANWLATLSDQTYTITVKNTDATVGKYIKFLYKATVNSNALTDTDERNTVTLSYSNYSQADYVEYNTYATGAVKYDGATATENNGVLTPTEDKITYLSAKFKLQVSSDNGTNWTDVIVAFDSTGKYYYPATGTTVDIVSDNENGQIMIRGLDSGKKYQLVEIEAPSGGYNMMTDAAPLTLTEEVNDKTKVSIDEGSEADTTYLAAANVIKIANNKGSQLPSTGGMGTTVLYIIGAILVVGAAVILIARRRTNKED